MSRLSISKAWEDTKEVVAREARLLINVALALVALPQTILAVVGAPIGVDATPLSKIVYVVVILIGLAAQIALNRLAIGPSTSVGGAVSRGFLRLPAILGAFFVLVLGLFVVVMMIAFGMAAAGVLALPAAGQPPPPGLIVVMLIFVSLSFAIFQLTIPVAAAESGGSLRLMSRSWQLGRGDYLRLLAFVAIVFIGMFMVALVVRFVFGSSVILLLGQPSPASASALILGLIAGVLQGAFTIVSAVMLARIYVQLTGGSEAQASVPRSGT